MSNKISYSAVVLDKKEQDLLFNKFKTLIPDGWEYIGHHMTIKLGELPEKLKSLNGKIITLKIKGIGLSDRAMALMVDDSESISERPIPHITIAINKNNGAKPKDSNDIKEWKDLKFPFSVTGTIMEIPF